MVERNELGGQLPSLLTSTSAGYTQAVFRRRASRRRTRYWVNGHGPIETAAERDELHATLREVAGWNRRAVEVLKLRGAL